MLWWGKLRLPLSSLRQLLSSRLAEYPTAPEGEVTASVAVILTPDPDSLLLIRRADREGDPWSGHMGLPGGRRQDEDTDVLATCLRETAEEVGVNLLGAALLGVLADVAPRTPVLPPVVVRPFVFWLADRPSLRLNSEISRALWVSFDDLLSPRALTEATIDVAGVRREFPGYRVAEELVWGMTERVVTSLLDVVREHSP